MGQQQLLLIVLAVIIVGISFIAGMTIYRSYITQANREQVVADLNIIAADAQAFYRRSIQQAGGQSSFLTYRIPFGFNENANGTYAVKSVIKDQIVLTGTGVEPGEDGSPVSYDVTVTPGKMVITKNN